MIKYDLKNRVAIVTGGAQGFGLAITERFIESGAKVIIWDIDESEAKKALGKVNSENLTYQIVDVSNYETINSKLSEIESKSLKSDSACLAISTNSGLLWLISITDKPNPFQSKSSS